MRCVVCGRRPSEPCNRLTHDAHLRMWKEDLNRQHQVGTMATQIVNAIEGRTPLVALPSPETRRSRVWDYRKT